MGDSLITIVAIFLAAILMFVFPLAAISEMNDSEALAMVQSYTTEFVNQIRVKGKITQADYDSYVQKLSATGNSYEVEFEVQIADANPGKKTENQQIGDTTYYGVYTAQITTQLNSGTPYLLKEGDYVSVSVKNTNTTISQMIKGVLYSVTGNQSYVISAQASGAVVATGY
jgi:hypothetical protein